MLRAYGGNASIDIETATLHVKVEVLGHLRQYTGRKDLEVELTEPTITGLIEELSSMFGENFREEIVSRSSGEFKVAILVNGNDIDFLQKSKTSLRNDDRITLIPHVAGG